jgi:hypothetical protein
MRRLLNSVNWRMTQSQLRPVATALCRRAGRSRTGAPRRSEAGYSEMGAGDCHEHSFFYSPAHARFFLQSRIFLCHEK